MFQKLFSYCFAIILLIAAPSSAQITDSIASKKHSKFYVEALVGVDFLNYLNKNDNAPGNPRKKFYFENFNGNYLHHPPTVKLGINCVLNKHWALSAGFKYSYFATQMYYHHDSFVYLLHGNGSPYGQITDILLTSKTNNAQVFVGAKVNFKNLYFSISLNCNTLFLNEEGHSYYMNAYYATPYINDSIHYKNQRSIEVHFGASLNIGYDFPINDKGNAIKLEAECDYIDRNMKLDHVGNYTISILNPAVCIGYRF